MARLPRSDVVVRSRMKFGASVNVITGLEDVIEGGRTLIYRPGVNDNAKKQGHRQNGRTSDLNCESEMVSDIGSLANEEVG